LDEKAKYRGKFEISNCSARRYYTFFDLQLRNKLNIVPIIGVDYSLANLTFDDNCYCIHTLKPGLPNDYVDVLRHVSTSFKNYSRFMVAYGFGARTTAGEGPACDLLSMTGDYADPFVQSEDELINCYAGTIKTVRLALPVNYKKIVQFVCDLAQMEYGTASDATHIKNYYVVTLLMAGVIDDLEDSLNEILRAADLPISVVVIKIGPAADTDNDSALLFQKSAPVFKQCERVFIDVLDYERYKTKDPESEEGKLLQRQFGFDLIRNLPK